VILGGDLQDRGHRRGVAVDGVTDQLCHLVVILRNSFGRNF
jgi:hypothetical protein